MSDMKRREFITLLGGAAAGWPVAARAQQPARMRRIGVLMNGAATEVLPQSYLAAFVQAMSQLGWTEGQNFGLDVRWNAGDAVLARTYSAQMIGLMPDVILVASTANLTVIQEATSTIPVVFVQVSDPIEQGFIRSLMQPGGNLTGFSAYEFSTGSKWLHLLKEIAPDLARVGVVFNPDTSPQSKFFMRVIETAAPSLGLQAKAVTVRTTEEIQAAFESFAQQPNGGLIFPTDSFTRLRQDIIIDLVGRYKLPSVSAQSDFPRNGGLMYYGAMINLVGQYQQAATYVDRILKGAKPSDLPAVRPNRYTLVLNLKAAKALGLTVPLPLLGLADEVIE
jgi:putative ABC transport system substrate-binding protein